MRLGDDIEVLIRWAKLGKYVVRKARELGLIENKVDLAPPRVVRPCPLCGVSFQVGRAFDRHIKDCAGRPEEPKGPEQASDLVTCRRCGVALPPAAAALHEENCAAAASPERD
jgi:hypothetical protein